MNHSKKASSTIKWILVIFLIILSGYIVLDGWLFEGWKDTGRNLDKSDQLVLGGKFSVEFEDTKIEVSKSAKYRKVTFPLPALMPYVTGYVVYRESDKVIVKMRIGDETESIQDLPDIEWMQTVTQ